MAVFHVCLDESGKFKSLAPDYTSLCGYIGSAHEWERFSERWDSIRLANSLPPIHVSDMMSFQNEWYPKKQEWGEKAEEKRNECLERFALLIQQADIRCVGAAVDAAYFRKMPQCEFKRKAEDPYFLSFQQAILASLRCTELLRNNTISLIMDDDQEYSMKCYKLLNKVRLRYPDISKRITGICFVDDNTYPPVQAADMIAYYSRQQLISLPKSPLAIPPADPMFVCLTRGLSQQPRFFSGDVLEEARQNVDAGSDAD